MASSLDWKSRAVQKAACGFNSRSHRAIYGMKTFEEWLMERGLRTCLGCYPPQYGSGQYPPLYFAPISAGATRQLLTSHKDEHPELFNPEIVKKLRRKDKLKK